MAEYNDGGKVSTSGEAHASKDIISARMSELGKHFSTWCIWQIAFPLAITLLIWPISYINGIKNAYQASFSNGDLLLFSSMLLIGVSIQDKNNGSLGLHILHNVARAISLILIFIMGLIKYDVMNGGYFTSVNPIPGKITVYACFSLSAVLVSIMFSTFMYWKSLSEKETGGI